MFDLFYKVPARKINYALVVLLIIAAIINVATNSFIGLRIWTLAGGFLGLIRPRLILDFFEEENKRKKLDFDPLFTEKTYKIIGYLGGGFLIAINLLDFLLIISGRTPVFFV